MVGNWWKISATTCNVHCDTIKQIHVERHSEQVQITNMYVIGLCFCICITFCNQAYKFNVQLCLMMARRVQISNPVAYLSMGFLTIISERLDAFDCIHVTCTLKHSGSIPRMHVSPAKHSYVWLPRKCDYRTDGQTDAGQSDPYVPLSFACDTTIRFDKFILHKYCLLRADIMRLNWVTFILNLYSVTMNNLHTECKKFW